MALAIPPDAELYLNFRQMPPATLWLEFLLKQIMTYVVRSSGDPAAMVTEVQWAIHRVDPERTVLHVATMQEIVSASVKGPPRSFYRSISGVALGMSRCGPGSHRTPKSGGLVFRPRPQLQRPACRV
jgi:hypothetical protein